jgi:hypothetical protein
MLLPDRIFDLYYGQSGSGKSEAARKVAIAIHKATGKKIRVVIGDGSLPTYQSLVDRGIVEAMEFSHRHWPPDTTNKLSGGHWPEVADDLDSPLLPPNDKSMEDVGGYIFEGASVFGTYIMGSVKGGLADLAGKGVKIGQDSPFQIFQGEKIDGKATGPGTTIGGNAQSHYMVAQRLIVDAVQRSRGLAPYVLWTAHEATNDPDKSALMKEMIVGPEVAGKALTVNFQRIFGNTVHCQSIAKRGKIKDEHTGKDMQELDLDYRLWTRDHFSPDNNTTIRYKALTRNVEGDFPPYFDDITKYYPAILESQKKALDALFA